MDQHWRKMEDEDERQGKFIKLVQKELSKDKKAVQVRRAVEPEESY